MKKRWRCEVESKLGEGKLMREQENPGVGLSLGVADLGTLTRSRHAQRFRRKVRTALVVST